GDSAANPDSCSTRAANRDAEAVARSESQADYNRFRLVAFASTFELLHGNRIVPFFQRSRRGGIGRRAGLKSTATLGSNRAIAICQQSATRSTAAVHRMPISI